MGVVRRRLSRHTHRHTFSAALAAFALLLFFFFFFSSSSAFAVSLTRSVGNFKPEISVSYMKSSLAYAKQSVNILFLFESESTRSLTGVRTRSVATGGGFDQEVTGSGFPGRIEGEKRFIGPGSSPPTCKSKCGSCEPCKPVHVPIQPGLSTPLEYYPEAWRCKCGNKLYMP